MTRDEPADHHQRSPAPGPCPDQAKGGRCTYPLCDHFCGEPPRPIFGEARDA